MNIHRKIKPGYKFTDIGPVPVDWEVVQFSELFDFRNGVNADKHAYGKGIPFINVLEIITKTHLAASDIPGKIALSNGQIDSYAVQHGDLLFNRTSETQEEVGLTSVYLDENNVVFGGFVIRGRPKRADIDPVYSGYAFRAPAIRTQIVARGQGAIRANIGQADLKQVLVPLPSLPEQHAIADALSDADALIAGLDVFIAKKRDLKQAAMQQLLAGNTRLPGFSNAWHTTKLGRLGVFSKGRGIKKDEVASGGLPCIRYGEIYTHHNDYVRRFYSFIPPEIARQSEPLRKGDLLFAASGETSEEIGKCVAFLSDTEVYAGGDIIIFRPAGQNSKYLGYLMNHTSITAQKARMGQGDAVVHISARNLSKVEFPLPDPVEQAAIASVLSDMDEEIASLEERRNKSHALKQAMMQELLTGRTRLV